MAKPSLAIDQVPALPAMIPLYFVLTDTDLASDHPSMFSDFLNLTLFPAHIYLTAGETQLSQHGFGSLETRCKPSTLAASGELVRRVSLSVVAARRRLISAESAYRVRSVRAPPLSLVHPTCGQVELSKAGNILLCRAFSQRKTTDQGLNSGR